MDQPDLIPFNEERGETNSPPSPRFFSAPSSAPELAPVVCPAGASPVLNARLEAQARALRVALAEDFPEDYPLPADAANRPGGASASVISTSGTIQDIGIDPADVPPSDDPYLDLNAEYSALDWPKPGTPDNCGAPFRTVRACGCESKRVGDHCDRSTCAHNYCRDVNRKRRAKDIGARIEHNRRGRDLIYSIFTVPPSCRKAASEKVTLRARNQKRDEAKAAAVQRILAGYSTPEREAAVLGIKENSVRRLVKKARDGKDGPAEVWRWQLWVAELLEYMKAELDLDFAVERSDPAGAKNPGRWHPHVNLLWVRKFEVVETEYGGRRRIRRSGFLSPEQLGLLKAKWREIVGQADGAPIVVWSRYAKDADARKRGFWYSYAGRTWPEWEEAFPYHCRVKWFGKPEASPDEERETCCAKCGLEVAVVRTGSEEAAEALALRGYAVVLQESRDRLAELRKMADRRKPVPFRGLLAYVDQVLKGESRG